jgi:hypothetical protein
VFEWIRDFGSLFGLVAGIVYFYERLPKGRPIASLKISKRDARKLACIRLCESFIKNLPT